MDLATNQELATLAVQPGIKQGPREYDMSVGWLQTLVGLLVSDAKKNVELAQQSQDPCPDGKASDLSYQ